MRHTGLDLEKVERSMERDNFMSPVEAKEFGIIDQILKNPPKLQKNANVPNTPSNQPPQPELLVNPN